MSSSDCLFCREPAGEVLWQDERCRVIWPRDPQYPGMCRVVWNAHVKEMSDLPSADRAHVMRLVFAVELALRALLAPDKINVASLGNVVPHIHWHIIPRYASDAHFPGSIWSTPLREYVASLPPNFAATVKERLSHL